MSVPARYRRTRSAQSLELDPEDVDAGVDEPFELGVVEAVDDGLDVDVDELSDVELDEPDESPADVLAVRDAEPPRLSVL